MYPEDIGGRFTCIPNELDLIERASSRQNDADGLSFLPAFTNTESTHVVSTCRPNSKDAAINAVQELF